MSIKWLNLTYILVYLTSLLALVQINHIERIYNQLFLDVIGMSWDFDPLIKTCILISIYSILFILGYILLFSRFGLKRSDNKFFTLTLIFLLVFLSFTVTFMGNNEKNDFNSDNDEALELWLGNFLNSDYPYKSVTQLGNHISIFPFLPFYSLPFYLMGNVAWQNIVNVLIIIYIFWKFTSTRSQLNFGLMSLLIAVPFYIFLFAQSDHITVAAFALLGLYLLNEKRMTIGSVIFGLLIASKAYIWLFIPTTLYHIFSTSGKADLKKSIIIYVLISLVIIGPFLLWNPNYFFTIAPIGVNAVHLQYFAFSELFISIGVIIISLYSYYKTKNIFVAFLITYISFSLFLFYRVMLIDILALIMIGISCEHRVF